MALDLYSMDVDSAFANLSSADPASKTAALKQLAAMGESGAAEMGYGSTVAGLLFDQDDDVVLAACEALASMGDIGAGYADSIASMLTSSQEKKRCFAIGALGMMGPKAAKHALSVKPLLSEANPSIRASAVLALGSMKDTSMVKDVAECLKDKFPSVVNGAITALALLGEEGKAYAPDVAKKLAGDSSKEVKTSAIMYFEKFDDLAVKYSDPIVDLLKDDEAAVRQSVVSLFSSLKGTAGPMLAGASKLLSSTDTGVKAAAALCIGAMGPDASSQAAALMPLLSDASEDNSQQVYCVAGIETKVPASLKIPCCAAASALASIKDGSSAGDIALMLDSDNMDIKLGAAAALGELGGPYAQALLPLLEDARAPVRGAACAALGNLAALGAPDGDVADQVAGILDDASPVVRYAAIEALGKMGEEGARFTDAFKETMDVDRSLLVRGAAIKAMGSIGMKGQCYASDVCRCIYDEEPAIRVAALQTLADMGERGASFADEVAELLYAQEVGIRVAALESIGKMGDAALPYLENIEACKDDPFPVVCDAAQAAAASLGGRQAIE
mmetsp:Transcript_129235/g.275652  ORF Transcript_129235/g.275652 Transcript_129235/m.275652 type:complete len:560 (-) Transcript_129235:93-1772(-)